MRQLPAIREHLWRGNARTGSHVSIVILTEMGVFFPDRGPMRLVIGIILILLLAVTLASSWGIWTILTSPPSEVGRPRRDCRDACR